MNYPTISEYIESIRFAEDNFATLTNLRPVLDDDGNPIMSSGNFAVVFKMTDGEKNYAVKCFIKEQEERSKTYKIISRTLSSYKEVPYLLQLSYLDFELYVNTNNSVETEFPILLMDWVEGVTLDKYIRSYIGNSFVLHDLCVSFCKMCQWLAGASIAHGDLKPDNIIVKKDGSIVLVDYDGMFVPELKGRKAKELGSVNYRHPLRSIDCFNSNIDDFSMAVLALSLKIISVDYGILDRFNCEESFIFKEHDYLMLKDSLIIQEITDLMFEDTSIAPYFSTFLQACKRNLLTSKDFDMHEVYVSDMLVSSTRSLGFKRSDEPMDEYGVIYSYDGTKVLSFDYEATDKEDIFIKEGVIVICENAFSSYKRNRKLNITLPKSLRFFNTKSFDHNYKNLSWKSPWFTYDNGIIYTKDFSECILIHSLNCTIKDTVKIIGRKCFYNIRAKGIEFPNSIEIIEDYAFEYASIDDEFWIPKNVIKIGQHSFSCCKSLIKLYFNQKLRSLGEWSFSFCDNLTEVFFPSSCKLQAIGSHSFNKCENLSIVHFPSVLVDIADGAFNYCRSLKELNLPMSLIKIGKSAFCCNKGFIKAPGDTDELYNSCLTELIIPESVSCIGEDAFNGINSLQKVSILGAPKLGGSVFANCTALKFFEAPNVVELSKSFFGGCYELVDLKCPMLEQIREYAFSDCNQLVYTMPETLTYVEHGAFNGTKGVIVNQNFTYDNEILIDINCKTLITCNYKQQKLIIPEGVVNVSKKAFMDGRERQNYRFGQIILPYSLSDISICEILELESTYVKIPYGRDVDNMMSEKPYLIKADIYGYDSVFIDVNGVLYTEDKHKLLKFPMNLSIEKYTVCLGCEEIGERAFVGDEDYDPEFGISYYGNELKELMLPNGLKTISKEAFDGCRELVNLVLPDTIIKIHDYAFKGCHSLESIYLPASLEYIGREVFPTKIEQIKSSSPLYISKDDCLYKAENNEILWLSSSIKLLNLPRTCVYKGKPCNTYSNCIVSVDGELLYALPNIEHFDFPNDVKIIGRSSFGGNKKLKEIRIPKGVVTIRSGAFGYNQQLKAVYLPSTISHIGDLKAIQGWGRKYIEFFYPQEIHVPRNMKNYFYKLLPGINEDRIYDDYEE